MAAPIAYCWTPRVCELFGISGLYKHQETVIQALLDGRDVFLSVCTSGGKSLCYMAYPEAAKLQFKVGIVAQLVRRSKGRFHTIGDRVKVAPVHTPAPNTQLAQMAER